MSSVSFFIYFVLRGYLNNNSLALVYNAINSSIDHARGKHDVLGSMAAGGISGALYKSTGDLTAFILLYIS